MMLGLGHKRINSNTLKIESAKLYGVISQKKALFVVTVVRT
jgi:hypothetical protein